MKKLLGFGLLALIGIFILIQLIPYGRQHTNPPVVKEPNWGSPEARQIAQRACFDCHSNETVWTWYSNIAPFSWLIQRDVDEGRQALNFSEWGVATRGEGGGEGGEGGEGEGGEGRERGGGSLEGIAETLQRDSMPPGIYIIQHPSARLSEAEKQVLIDGLQGAMALK